MADEKRLGVYIWTGDGIAEGIDCNKLAEELQGQGNVQFVKVVDELFTTNGVDNVRKDIADNELTGVVIGGSSPRFHTELFQFDSNVMVDRVSLREGVAWTHEPNDRHTQDMALDYMKMGIAKLNTTEPPEPEIVDINDSIMVVGGGVAGMNAALSSAKAGYSVVLVEKEKELGGYFNKLYKITPRTDPYYELEPNTCEGLISEVYADPNISVFTNTTVKRTSGAPGMFNVTAQNGNGKVQFQVGSIVQATGWKVYDPHKLGHLGYGKYQNVITNIEMEERAKQDNITRPSDGKKVDSVVFIQCAGSRDKDHLPYCSGFCCMTSLKQAMYVREKYPDAAIYIVYKDIRTPAQYEHFYKRVQSEDNIFLTKGEIAGMEEGENGKVRVDADDTLIGEQISIDADLVVLATGMQPTTLVEENGHPGGEEFTAEEGQQEEQAQEQPQEAQAEEGEEKEMSAAAGAEAGAKILNLAYRQGTDLPTLRYGFPDSHYICFPYETRRTGVYAAGTVRAPMDMTTATNDALGASLKAIQAIENIKEGKAVHPRSGDTSFPDFFLQRCTQCKRCTEECPFGTLDEDVKGTPLPNLTRCRRCGICMGACPERIINFKNYSIRMVSNMIKSIYVPTEEEDGEATPRMLAFMCENDAYPSLDTIARKRIKYSPNLRVIPVRCLGSVNTSWIADALSAGFDGVILFGCVFGDDYQCHFIRGSELANKRMENVQEKLKQLVLEPERVELHMLAIDEYHKLPDILNNFAKTIEEVGPNPYKEM